MLHLAKNLSSFYPCPESCMKLNLKCGRLIKSGGGKFKVANHVRNFKEAQHAGSGMDILSYFSKTCSKNQDQLDLNDLKSFSLSRKEVPVKLEQQKVWLLNRLATLRSSFEKRGPGCPASSGIPRESSSQIQPFRNSEAVVAMVQRRPATA